MTWTPLPGPQTQALESEADEVYYGGGAGGGKTDLLLGYGLVGSRHGIIFRREFKQLEGARALLERSKEIVGRPELFNNSKLVWRLGDRLLEFGAVEHEDHKFKYQGRAHDYKGFDELAQFTESQYLYLCGWARTTIPGQRVRIIAAGNPPQSAEGEWVIKRWAPWLDEQHPNPARPGELRWFVRTAGGEEVEVEGPEPVELGGEILKPKSRTFIPARVTDNPYLMATDYLAQLQQLPEPLRSQLIYGDHTIGLADDEWQVIPTAWVRAAQARWSADGRPKDAQGRPLPADAIGVDPARGGGDRTALVVRVGTWFGEVETQPGATTPDGRTAADRVGRAQLEHGGPAIVDCDGVGVTVYELLRERGAEALAYVGSAKTAQRDKSGRYGFVNVRAAAWWALREALDPDTGAGLALPPDRELRVELCAPRFEIKSNGIQLEDKDEVKKRLGRSPDKGDAVVMAHWDDPYQRLARLMGTRSSVEVTGQAPKPEPWDDWR